MSPEMVQAIDLITSLRPGDRVKVTRDGRTNVMNVQSPPSRSDGRFGSPESTGVTVSYGPGRYATRVEAGDLVRTRRGRGCTGGGTELSRVTDDLDEGEDGS